MNLKGEFLWKLFSKVSQMKLPFYLEIFFAQNTEKCVKSLGENTEKREISEMYSSFNRLENILLNNKVNSQNEIAQLRKDR